MRPYEELNIVYFGMMGLFSCRPLETLLECGHTVSAIVLPALDTPHIPRIPTGGPLHAARSPAVSTKRNRLLPQLSPPATGNLRQIARDQGIPILEAGSLHSTEIRAEIAACRPDAICVACFSQRIPAQLLRIPRLGSVNIHPSLLPDNRGPDPLFWTFRRGDLMTGVTVHLMDERFDSGPLLAQEPVAVPDGISERALEKLLASHGGDLLAQALTQLAAGSIDPIAQDDTQATYFPVPGSQDWIITPDRSAHWAYNFASGLWGRSVPILIQVQDQTFQLQQPLEFEEQGVLPQAWLFDGTTLELSCTPGVFRARAVTRSSAE